MNLKYFRVLEPSYILQGTSAEIDAVQDVLDNMIVGAHCNCKACVVAADKPANPFAIVPYKAKEDVAPQDCICCNVLSTMSYEFVYMAGCPWHRWANLGSELEHVLGGVLGSG